MSDAPTVGHRKELLERARRYESALREFVALANDPDESGNAKEAADLVSDLVNALTSDIQECDSCGEERRVAWWYEDGDAPVCAECLERDLLKGHEALAALTSVQTENGRLQESKTALIDKVKRLEDRIALKFQEGERVGARKVATLTERLEAVEAERDLALERLEHWRQGHAAATRREEALRRTLGAIAYMVHDEHHAGGLYNCHETPCVLAIKALATTPEPPPAPEHARRKYLEEREATVGLTPDELAELETHPAPEPKCECMHYPGALEPSCPVHGHQAHEPNPERPCGQCGRSWGQHRNGDDLCPGPGLMNWDNSPGTHFVAAPPSSSREDDSR